MCQSSTLPKSTSPTETSGIHSQILRAPEERFPHTFKSLFTLADVAAKRRANGGVKKLTLKTDENQFGGGQAAGSSVFLKRSKSSGDVAILGETSRALNVAFEVNVSEKHTKPVKGLRSRSVTISASPSKIPKGKSLTFLHTTDIFPAPSEDDSASSLVSNTCVDLPEADALKVDDALFVMLTPPQTPVKKTSKNLTLAAHVPSLPKIASPFSPRINQPWSSCHQPRAATRAAPGTGHTSASLHLTKSHWELRYETWVQSLRKPPRPRSARSIARPVSRTKDESPPRSRFPAPLTNPALFPRAGSLMPTALRPVLDGSVAEEDARPALELDWAMRAWPLDKIQRALFIHDMDVRVWFPVGGSDFDGEGKSQEMGSELELTRVTSVPEDDEKEQERGLRRWEWDWELRWRVIEGMAEEDHDRDRAECEYDVFLAEENSQQDQAYGGCDTLDGDLAAAERMVEVVDWAWSDEAMEVDTSQ